MNPSPAELMGLPFARVDLPGAVARCLEWCDAPRATHVVLTANASHLCMMRRDPALDGACRQADLVVADGLSVVWALRAAGTPVPERVAGIDLMTALLRAGAARRLRAYFLGARQEVVAALVERCAREFPGLVVTGFRNGYFGPAEHAAIVEDVRRREPHLLFIGMPSPFKEVFAELHRQRLATPVVVGVGGSFDVLAGFIRRAPRWVQRTGLEWAWRLAMEPRKLWKRYLTTNSEFLWAAGREALSRRLGRRAARSQRTA